MILPPLPSILVLLEDPFATGTEDVLVAGPAPQAPATQGMPALDVAEAAPKAPLADEAPPATAMPPAPAEAPTATVAPQPTPDPAPAAAPAHQDTAPLPASPSGPGFALPAEDAFPSLAALDAIRAAHAGPPAGPDAAERAELAALLGIDPAFAADADLFAATIAALPAPDGDQLLAEWLDEAGIGELASPSPAGNGDWLLG